MHILPQQILSSHFVKEKPRSRRIPEYDPQKIYLYPIGINIITLILCFVNLFTEKSMLSYKTLAPK